MSIVPLKSVFLGIAKCVQHTIKICKLYRTTAIHVKIRHTAKANPNLISIEQEHLDDHCVDLLKYLQSDTHSHMHTRTRVQPLKKLNGDYYALD